MNKKISIILSLMFLFISSSIFAETIMLKSGKTVEGKILDKTDKYIKVDTEGIPITYYLEDIESIDGKTVAKQSSSEQAPILSTANNAEDYFNNAIAQDKQGNLEQAISNYTKSIELNPNGGVGAYYNRGVIYYRQGNYSQAIADYTKAIEIKPNLAGAYNSRGVIYKKQGNFAQAISDFNKAIEINPNFANAYANRGSVYDDKEDLV